MQVGLFAKDWPALFYDLFFKFYFSFLNSF